MSASAGSGSAPSRAAVASVRVGARALPPRAVVMQLDLQPGPGLVAPLTWVAAHQLAVSAVRPLVLALPSVRVMALMPSAAPGRGRWGCWRRDCGADGTGIAAAGLCPRQVRSPRSQYASPAAKKRPTNSAGHPVVRTTPRLLLLPLFSG